MKRDDIIRKVKARLKDAGPMGDSEEFANKVSMGGRTLDVLIQENVAPACDSVLLNVPLYLVKESVTDATSSTLNVVDEVGYIDKPADYLRMYSISMSNWKRKVHTAISPDNSMYLIQQNKHVRGRVVKPVVAINNGKLELYSCVGGATLKEFKYISKTDENCTSVEDSIADMVVLQIAIMICESLNEPNVSLLVTELNNLIESVRL